MANIFVNGLNLSIGGGKNILENYIKQLFDNNLTNNYYVLTPDYEKYNCFSKKNLIFVDVENIYKNNIFFLLLYFFKYPQLLRDLKIDLVFNFGDVIIPTNISQIYFFDWAYAVYDSKNIWRNMDFKNYIIRKMKVFLISRYIKKVELIFVQTKNIRDRLKSKFQTDKIELVPTPIGLDLSAKKHDFLFNLPKNNVLFLYPASYSAHKNFNIILEVGKLIKFANLPFIIILTLNPQKATNFIKEIQFNNLQSIFNIGPTKLNDMPNLYRQCDALLFPSLLESYGLPLVEAMALKKPILTSDLDFAHSLCNDVAFYFDPMNANSILDVMKSFSENKLVLNDKIKAGSVLAKSVPDWSEVFIKFEKKINLILKKY